MPLYEYQCPECGTFERMQKFSDPVLTACPTCENPVEKLLSAPAIQFKGSGWYVTDYAGKGKDKDKGPGEAKAKDAKGDKDSGSAKSEGTKKASSSSARRTSPPRARAWTHQARAPARKEASSSPSASGCASTCSRARTAGGRPDSGRKTESLRSCEVVGTS